jgi:type IV secretion system protein VirD4
MSKITKGRNLGAHWASPKEIKEAGLLGNEGFLLGLRGNKRIIDSSYKNVLLIHPLGHGKGISIMIPNLLSWKESVIINDSRAENYKLTSGYRKSILGQRVFIWDPANRGGTTHCYNPLDYLRGKPMNMIQKTDEIQKIARILLPGDGIYNGAARSLIATIILCLGLGGAKNNTLGGVLEILAAGDLGNYLKSALDRFGDKIGWFGQININAFLSRTNEERGLLRSMAMDALELWSDPQINASTSKSDFNVADFDRENSTLYVVTHPMDAIRLRPLLQIFYQQCISALTLKDREPYENKTGVLMILDEFCSLGRMEFMDSALAYSRGHKLKICLSIGDIDSLENVYGYGGACSILARNEIKVACCTSNHSTMNFISSLLGKEIVKFAEGSREELPLMLPSEIAQMNSWEAIIILGPMVIEGEKFKYYEDPEFEERLLKPAHTAART